MFKNGSMEWGPPLSFVMYPGEVRVPPRAAHSCRLRAGEHSHIMVPGGGERITAVHALTMHGQVMVWYGTQPHHTEVLEGCSLSASFTSRLRFTLGISSSSIKSLEWVC